MKLTKKRHESWGLKMLDGFFANRKSSLSVVFGVAAILMFVLSSIATTASSSPSSTKGSLKKKHTTEMTDADRHKANVVFIGSNQPEDKPKTAGWAVDGLCLHWWSNILVYSVGIGHDNIDWETGILQEYGADHSTVHMFDPMETSVAYTEPYRSGHHGNKCFWGGGCLTHTPEGLSTKTGNMTFPSTNPADNNDLQLPVKTLDVWMSERRHDYLDILKLDIDGNEYDVLEDLLDRRFLPFTQLLVHFHDDLLSKKEKERAKTIRERLVDPLDGGFIEVSSQKKGQQVTYVKPADFPYCGDGCSSRGSASSSSELPITSRTDDSCSKGQREKAASLPSNDVIKRHKESKLFKGDVNAGWPFDTICLKGKDQIIVYGVGAGENIGWDTGLLDEYGTDRTTVHIFDPTPKSINYTTPIVKDYIDNKCIGGRPCLTHTAEGLSTEPGNLTFFLPPNVDHVSMRQPQLSAPSFRTRNVTVTVPVNSLDGWMKERDHTYLDILKIDIEGSEYAVLEDLLDRKYFPFTQLLVEYHDRFLDGLNSKKLHQRLTDPMDGGFFLLSLTLGQEAVYVKLADLPYCEDGRSERVP